MEEKYYSIGSTKIYTSDVRNGLIWMVASAVCSGLGNGLQTISPLAHLHIFTLLIGFEYLTLGFGRTLFGHACTFSLTVIIQACGTVLGFVGAVSKDDGIGLSLGYALSASLIKWFLLTFLALYLHHSFMVKFPKSLLIPVVFPAAHTAVSMIIIGYSAGTFTILGGAVLDYAPLRYIAVVFGLGGVHFTVVCCGTYAALCYMRYRKIPIQQMAVMNLALLLLALACGAFLMQSGWLYQQSVSRHVTDTLPVSCVLGQDARLGSEATRAIYNVTETRALAGDHIVLMSESAFKVTSSNEASLLLTDFSNIARNTGDSTKPYIGVTYSSTEDDGESYTNRFVLIGPDGSVLWNYRKAYPNAVVESNVRPGEMDLPTATAHSGIGKLGGAIGFDLDHPHYIHQAGQRGVHVLLQPAWTWQSVGPRHFDNNALRAIENGFTLFRCSSDGVSGVVSGRGPWGSVANSQIITGHDAHKPALFQMPVRIRNLPKADGVLDKTFYVICGFAFDWVMLCFCVIVGIFTLFPFKENEYRSVPVLQHALTAPNGRWSEFSFFPGVDSYYSGYRPGEESGEFELNDGSPQADLRRPPSGSFRRQSSRGRSQRSNSAQENGVRRVGSSDRGAASPDVSPPLSASGKPRPKGPSWAAGRNNSSSNR